MQNKEPSVGGVWIFSGTTHLDRPPGLEPVRGLKTLTLFTDLDPKSV